MNEAAVIEVTREAIYTLLIVVGPLLIAAMLVGLLIGIIQTLTQIQEMTLVFVPKILLVFVILLFMLPFMMGKMTAFAQSMFDRAVALGT